MGVGLSSRATVDELRTLVGAVLAEAGIDGAEVRCLATIDRHERDPRVVALGWPIVGRLASELDTVVTDAPSHQARDAVGTASVAEAAALLVAGPGAHLVVAKRRSAHATAAVAAPPP